MQWGTADAETEVPSTEIQCYQRFSLSVSLSVCLSLSVPPAPSPLSLFLEMTYFRWILYTSTCMPGGYHFRCLVLYSLLGKKKKKKCGNVW